MCFFVAKKVINGYDIKYRNEKTPKKWGYNQEMLYNMLKGCSNTSFYLEGKNKRC